MGSPFDHLFDITAFNLMAFHLSFPYLLNKNGFEMMFTVFEIKTRKHSCKANM
jgi:hypothetical protein